MMVAGMRAHRSASHGDLTTNGLAEVADQFRLDSDDMHPVETLASVGKLAILKADFPWEFEDEGLLFGIALGSAFVIGRSSEALEGQLSSDSHKSIRT